MSEAEQPAGVTMPGAHGHAEHLEVWPDAGITETAKKVPVWLVVLYIGFAVGLVVPFLHQFYWHSEGYPRYGPNYPHLADSEQYPDKVTPKIEMQAQLTWQVGKEAVLLLRASGGRVGRTWEILSDDANQPSLPPGVKLDATKDGMALVGTPTQAGLYTVHLLCRSGAAETDKVIEITVEDGAAPEG